MRGRGERIRTASLVALLAAALALPGTLAVASPSEQGAERGNPGGNSAGVRQDDPDYNDGKALGISRAHSEDVTVPNRGRRGQPPLGPAKVGSTQTWLGLDDYQGFIYLKDYTLRGVGENIEVWVADDRAFPDDNAGSCRNDLGTTEVTDEQVQNFIDEFDTNIYPKESAVFSVPPDRDGKHAALPGLIPELPSSAYHGEGDNIVVLVDNVRDTNYYDPTADDGKTYIAGFFYSVFNEYFDRNVMTIDVFDWLHRTGDDPPDHSEDPDWVACGEAIERPFGDPRPLLYEGVFAHEYQHLLEYYEDPDEVNWINEGLSDWAQTLVGYVNPELPPDDPNADSHMACFQGWLEPQSTYGGPENSLTAWGDQGAAETLCDYGATYTMMEYLVSHYGQEFMGELHRNDLGGLEGLDAVLDQFGATRDAMQHVRDWAAMVALDGALDANGGVLNGGDAATFQASSLTTKVNWDTEEAYAEPGAPANGSDYVRLRGESEAYLSASEITSISFHGEGALPTVPVQWVVDELPPDAIEGDASCQDPPGDGTGPAALYSGCGPNLDRAVVQSVAVPAADPTLTFEANWDTEVGWDFAYVQVSTDGGETWTSLSTADTTTEHDPGAIPAVVANLPGFDGESGGWTTQTADLSAYESQEILLAFRYITDSGLDESGFWVRNVSVGGTVLATDSLDGWQSMSEVNPTAIPGWTVQLIAHGAAEDSAWLHRMVLDGDFAGTLAGAEIAEAIGTEATTVAVLVMMDDPAESLAAQGRYTLTVNDVAQPGG